MNLRREFNRINIHWQKWHLANCMIVLLSGQYNILQAATRYPGTKRVLANY